MATTAVGTQNEIVNEIEIAAPPERVFAALTNSDQLQRWWFSPTCHQKVWQVDARDGGEWSFATGPSPKSVNGVNDFEAHGRILEFRPPHRLVYSWIANWNDKPDSVTIVEWDLVPTALGTRVKVTHSGLADQNVACEDYRGGWPGVVELLRKFVENR